MSGGRFNYDNDQAGTSIFGWNVNIDYGLGDRKYYMESVKEARQQNPFQDKQLSEMAYDLFCLLHSLDWYLPGDIGEDTYQKDRAFFKKKWLKPTASDLAAAEIEKSICECRAELLNTLLVKDGDADERSTEN